MSAAEMYANVLTLDWPTVAAELSRLDSLPPSAVRAEYQSLGFHTPYRSKRQAVERIRERVEQRKETHERVQMCFG